MQDAGNNKSAGSFIGTQAGAVSPLRLFLTGGSGYVGRNLVRHFVAKGVQVVALTRSARSAEVVRGLGAVPFAGDLLDAGLVDGMKGCQALIHKCCGRQALSAQTCGCLFAHQRRS
jgi:NAD(P)-dependent dehydrogenase (short-subunit alcohol dehydrogenase family)